MIEYVLAGTTIASIGSIAILLKRNVSLKEENIIIEKAFRDQGKKDMLIEIFDRQIELQKKWFKHPLPGNYPKQMTETIIGIVAEIGETLQEDKTWKTWCKNPPKPNLENKKKEIADFFHFAVNFCIYSDMDAQTLFKYYIGENEKNKNRQIKNY